MRTTVDLPDDLAIEAKKRAAELRIPLRVLIEEGLRARLGKGTTEVAPEGGKFKWVTVPGDLPDDLDLSDRTNMREWVERHQD